MVVWNLGRNTPKQIPDRKSVWCRFSKELACSLGNLHTIEEEAHGLLCSGRKCADTAKDGRVAGEANPHLSEMYGCRVRFSLRSNGQALVYLRMVVVSPRAKVKKRRSKDRRFPFDSFGESPYTLTQITSMSGVPERGLGLAQPNVARRFLHKWKSGLSRYRDNQCRTSGAGENKLRWHRGETRPYDMSICSCREGGFSFDTTLI